MVGINRNKPLLVFASIIFLLSTTLWYFPPFTAFAEPESASITESPLESGDEQLVVTKSVFQLQEKNPEKKITPFAKTGDDYLFMYVLVTLIVSIGLMVFVILRKRDRRENEITAEEITLR